MCDMFKIGQSPIPMMDNPMGYLCLISKRDKAKSDEVERIAKK